MALVKLPAIEAPQPLLPSGTSDALVLAPLSPPRVSSAASGTSRRRKNKKKPEAVVAEDEQTTASSAENIEFEESALAHVRSMVVTRADNIASSMKRQAEKMMGEKEMPEWYKNRSAAQLARAEKKPQVVFKDRTTGELAIDAAKETKTVVYKLFFHYGPPYKAEYGGDLPEECRDPNTSRLEVHFLLNDGADPRIGNLADYGNTPLHYAARHCNLRLAKMLLRAGAVPAQRNHLGMNALGTAAMFNPPEPRLKKHLKMCKWLIDRGADMDNIDRGGHSALEMASAWGNMELVTMLIQLKARVHREVEMLSISAPSAVEVAATQDVRALCRAKSIIEKGALEAARRKDATKKDEERELSLQEKRKNKISEAIAARKEDRKERRKLAVDVKSQAVQDDAQFKIDEQQRRQREALHAAELGSGAWRRRGTRLWRLDKSKEEEASFVQSTNVWEEAKVILDNAQGLQHQEMLKNRWKAMTGHELTDTHPIIKGAKAKKENASS